VLLDARNRAVVGDFGSSSRLRPRPPQTVVSAFTGRLVPVADIAVEPTRGVTAEECWLYTRGEMTKAVGTLLWMVSFCLQTSVPRTICSLSFPCAQAPEMFRGDTNYGAKIDVYSFGIILWEIATRNEPWAAELGVGDCATAFFIELNAALMSGRRPTIPAAVEHHQANYVAVMRQCWAADPSDRPDFVNVVSALASCLRVECTRV
jgi:serine/threonine protein kinase